MKTLFALLGLFSLLAPAMAQSALNRDLRLDPNQQDQGVVFAINGKFYHNIELVSVENGIAHFNTREGAVSARWASLPINVQNANAKAKAEYEQRAKAAKEEREGPEKIRIKVMQVLPNGVLADKMKQQMVSRGYGIGNGNGAPPQYRDIESGKTIFVSGIGGLTDGDELAIKASRAGIFTYDTNTVEKWTFTEQLPKDLPTTPTATKLGQ